MTKLNLLAVFVGAILSAGCASQRVEVPKEVRVSVPVPCVDAKPARPQFRSLSELLSMDQHDRTIAAWSELRKYEAYTAETDAVLEGCSRL
jgi:hypothetical protein